MSDIEEILSEVRERVRLEQLIDEEVTRFKTSEDYKKFIYSSEQSYVLTIVYEDSHNVTSETRVTITKVRENKNSCLNKTAKNRNLKKMLQKENLMC